MPDDLDRLADKVVARLTTAHRTELRSLLGEVLQALRPGRVGNFENMVLDEDDNAELRAMDLAVLGKRG